MDTFNLNHQQIDELLNRLEQSELDDSDKDIIRDLISSTLDHLDSLNKP